MSTPNLSEQPPPPRSNPFSEPVLIEIFTNFMRSLSTLVSAQMPDKAVAVQSDLAQLKAQLDTGEVKANCFTGACKRILATHLGDPGYVAVYNEAKSLVDRQIAQQQAARKQEQQQKLVKPVESPVNTSPFWIEPPVTPLAGPPLRLMPVAGGLQLIGSGSRVRISAKEGIVSLDAPVTTGDAAKASEQVADTNETAP